MKGPCDSPYQQTLDAKEGALEEQTHRYREIRHVLTQLVINMPGVSDRTWPGTALETAREYLRGHHAECGATLERHDYALVHAQEMVRIGTTTASGATNLRICPECYVLRGSYTLGSSVLLPGVRSGSKPLLTCLRKLFSGSMSTPDDAKSRRASDHRCARFDCGVANARA
jgi:hypothetical protein